MKVVLLNIKIVFLLFIFSNCNQELKENKQTNGNTLNIDFQPSYGFVIKNEK
jgi:hypothetical protein